jgi:hypothetical protein
MICLSISIFQISWLFKQRSDTIPLLVSRGYWFSYYKSGCLPRACVLNVMMSGLLERERIYFRFSIPIALVVPLGFEIKYLDRPWLVFFLKRLSLPDISCNFLFADLVPIRCKVLLSLKYLSSILYFRHVVLERAW